MIKFKERLKELRMGKGFSQTQLGEKLGVDYRTISNWENGVSSPTLIRWQELPNILKLV